MPGKWTTGGYFAVGFLAAFVLAVACGAAYLLTLSFELWPSDEIMGVFCGVGGVILGYIAVLGLYVLAEEVAR